MMKYIACGREEIKCIQVGIDRTRVKALNVNYMTEYIIDGVALDLTLSGIMRALRMGM